MIAIVNTNIGKLEMQEHPLPDTGPGQVRIKTAACGICATDLTMIAGCERSKFPIILGHEWSGIIDEAGSGVDSNWVGKHCVAENVLKDGGEVGFEHPGGYSEYFITEADNIQVLPQDFSLITAALIEPLAVSVRAVRRLRLEDDSRALIFGDGPIGLLILILLLRAGVKDTVMVGGRTERLAIASELGAARTFNYHELTGDLEEEIERAAGGSFPNVVEASGSAAAVKAAIQLSGRCSHILMIGDYDNITTDFNWQQLLLKELELIGSNASAGAWHEAVKLAASVEIPLERLVTHTVPAKEFEKAIYLTRSRESGSIKVVLDWTKK